MIGCRIRFVCVKPYTCEYYDPMISGTCRHDFLGGCINSKANKEAMELRNEKINNNFIDGFNADICV
jgi:hypothetical protein